MCPVWTRNEWRARHDSNVRPRAPQSAEGVRNNSEIALRFSIGPDGASLSTRLGGTKDTRRHRIPETKYASSKVQLSEDHVSVALRTQLEIPICGSRHVGADSMSQYNAY